MLIAFVIFCIVRGVVARRARGAQPVHVDSQAELPNGRLVRRTTTLALSLLHRRVPHVVVLLGRPVHDGAAADRRIGGRPRARLRLNIRSRLLVPVMSVGAPSAASVFRSSTQGN